MTTKDDHGPDCTCWPKFLDLVHRETGLGGETAERVVALLKTVLAAQKAVIIGDLEKQAMIVLDSNSPWMLGFASGLAAADAIVQQGKRGIGGTGDLKTMETQMLAQYGPKEG